MRYIVPKIFCVIGTLIILAGIFLSEVDITLGNNMLLSTIIAIGISAALLGFVILAYQLKQTDNMIRWRFYRTMEYGSIVLFVISGLSSLLIFNHCITVWQYTNKIQENMNIRQLENMLHGYENYANQRIKNYEIQLDNAILYKNMNRTDLKNLGLDINSIEDLNSQRNRKVEKLKQVVFPHIYDSLKVSISDSIRKFVSIVEDFSPITMPKNIIRIEEWVKSWETQLREFSEYKMLGENADNFNFTSTFGNVENMLTEWTDFFEEKRMLGYITGIISLIFMLFPYFKAKRSNKFNF